MRTTKTITVCGGGTAGLVSAIVLKSAFKKINVNIIESEKIGIIGVGEGSTEHWKQFMRISGIHIVDLLNRTKATHKNGIRFENWTNHTPDYFHSVTAVPQNTHFGVFGLYSKLAMDGKTLTENIAHRGMIENKVPADNPHESVNQFHFDTFLLNEYLHDIAVFHGINIIKTEIEDVKLESITGNIESVKLADGRIFESDLWIDASGMSRVLISRLEENNWNSFRDYLQMDSAIAFPTESDPSGEIRPYTRARATKNGWMWEIPTQERRGNGYVFSSEFFSEEEALNEAQKMTGYKINNHRLIQFEPGCLKKMWVKNCIAVGLSSSFVEPLEATSIGSTIQQARAIVDNLVTYEHNPTFAQNYYNSKMEKMMENILSMISIHYLSDRDDSEMWKKQKHDIRVPDYLSNLLELWASRPPLISDISENNYEMFLVPHFFHVAQGQKLINPIGCARVIEVFGINEEVKKEALDAKLHQTGIAEVDHAESLKSLQN